MRHESFINGFITWWRYYRLVLSYRSQYITMMRGYYGK